MDLLRSSGDAERLALRSERKWVFILPFVGEVSDNVDHLLAFLLSSHFDHLVDSMDYASLDSVRRLEQNPPFYIGS